MTLSPVLSHALLAVQLKEEIETIVSYMSTMTPIQRAKQAREDKTMATRGEQDAAPVAALHQTALTLMKPSVAVALTK